MANVPLKSITFPGLSDTYTVPQIDATLATSGSAADAKAVGEQLSAVGGSASVDVSGMSAEGYYINIGSSSSSLKNNVSNRSLMIPAKDIYDFSLACSVESTKRIGFVDTIENNATVYHAAEHTGVLSAKALNEGNHNYLVVQLFISTDSDTDATHYIPYLTITKKTAVDTVARDAGQAVADDLAEIKPNHILRPLGYSSNGIVYNGSSSPTAISNFNSGFAFDGFDKVESGSSNTYAVGRLIHPSMQPKVISAGSISVSVYAELADNVDSASFTLRLSTGRTWNAESQSIVGKSTTVYPGWNTVELDYNSAASASTAYEYALVSTNSLANIQKVKRLYIFIGTAAATAKHLEGFDPSDYYTKDEVDAFVDPLTYDYKMIFWGDSLTHGAGGDGTTFPKVCAQALGISNSDILNCGVGGENANTIAARQGGNALIIPAGDVNGTYAYTLFKDPLGGNVRPLRQGNGSHSGDTIYINGEECSLSITQTSSTSEDAVYTISGYTGGTSAVPLLAKFAGSNFKGNIVVIFAGQNGSAVDGVSDSVDARITIIDSMIRHIGHNRFVVLGLSSGNDSNRTTDDDAMRKHYGNYFFPTRKMLVEYGLTINGLTPTEQDTTDIAAGKVPESLRNDDDNVHLNAYGYTALGKMLADKIRSLGYV